MMQAAPAQPAQGMQASPAMMQAAPAQPAQGMQAFPAMMQGMQAFPAMMQAGSSASSAWPWTANQAEAQAPPQQAAAPPGVDMSLAFGAPAQAPDTVAMLAPSALDTSVVNVAAPVLLAPPP